MSHSAPLIVLIDDTRLFRDGRATHVARTSAQALTVLTDLDRQRIDELWLDYDLIGGSSQPVVDRVVEQAAADRPLDVGEIFVHSARVSEGHAITAQLRAAGYRARRSYSAGIWTRNLNPIHPQGDAE